MATAPFHDDEEQAEAPTTATDAPQAPPTPTARPSAHTAPQPGTANAADVDDASTGPIAEAAVRRTPLATSGTASRVLLTAPPSADEIAQEFLPANELTPGSRLPPAATSNAAGQSPGASRLPPVPIHSAPPQGVAGADAGLLTSLSRFAQHVGPYAWEISQRFVIYAGSAAIGAWLDNRLETGDHRYQRAVMMLATLIQLHLWARDNPDLVHDAEEMVQQVRQHLGLDRR